MSDTCTKSMSKDTHEELLARIARLKEALRDATARENAQRLRADTAERNGRLALDDARRFLPHEVSITCAQEAIHILAREREELATALRGFCALRGLAEPVVHDPKWVAAVKRAEDALPDESGPE